MTIDYWYSSELEPCLKHPETKPSFTSISLHTPQTLQKNINRRIQYLQSFIASQASHLPPGPTISHLLLPQGTHRNREISTCRGDLPWWREAGNFKTTHLAPAGHSTGTRPQTHGGKWWWNFGIEHLVDGWCFAPKKIAVNILTIKHPNAPLAWLVFQPMNNKMNLLLQGFFGQRAKKSNKDFTPVQTSLCSLSNDHLLQIRHVFPGNKTPHPQVLGGGKVSEGHKFGKEHWDEGTPLDFWKPLPVFLSDTFTNSWSKSKWPIQRFKKKTVFKENGLTTDFQCTGCLHSRALLLAHPWIQLTWHLVTCTPKQKS